MSGELRIIKWNPEPLLRSASPDDLRRVAIQAASYAVGAVGITDAGVLQMIRKLEAGITIDPEKRSELEALANNWDEKYLDLLDGDLTDAGAQLACQSAFAAARGAAAVFAATANDPAEACRNATYEAQAASGDPEAVEQLIRDALA